MLQAPQNGQNASIFMLEGSATLILVALAFFLPRLGSPAFKRIEQLFCRLAHRKALSVAVVGITTLLLRLALLPICPKPLPFLPDDFSFLLSADTFLHGRLTNPTPAMWMHLETIHVTMLPSYMSMYFPSNGLLLAAGQLLFGDPWYGLLVMSALMCAGICWMLQAWLPPTWALLGGALAILRLGLFSYWINTYTGGGTICALGGALVLGSLPRLVKTTKVRYGFLLALGIILLATTRPYEGLLLCLPVAVFLGHWAFFSKNRPRPAVLLQKAAGPLLLVIAAGAWMGYYDYRAFGSPATLPYTVDRTTYAVTPYYAWQPLRQEPHYRQAHMRRFYLENEMPAYKDVHKPFGVFATALGKLARSFLFYAGIALLPSLIMARRIFLDRRIRFLVYCALVLMAGMLLQIYLIPHYLAPFTAVFYAIGLQGMRHLRLWSPGGQPVGLAIVRYSIALCLVMAGFRVVAPPLHIMPEEWPASKWSGVWYGPGLFGVERAKVQNQLEHMDGKQLVLVRFNDQHDPLDQWVYNGADIDSSKVIWAWDMDPSQNAELLRYYKDRHVWLVQPDNSSMILTPYDAPQTRESDTRLSELIFPR